MELAPQFDSPLCAQIGGDFWFPNVNESGDSAKKLCKACPELEACREWVINSNPQPEGIWGGMSFRQVRKERIRRGIVVSNKKDQ